MCNRVVGPAGVIAAVIAGVLLASVPAGGQMLAGTAKTWNPPRTPDGQPDVQGYWNRETAGLPTYSIEGPPDERHLAIGGFRGNARKDPRLIVDPPDGKIPYQPWAAAIKKEIIDSHLDPTPKYVDPHARCFQSGVPRANYWGPFHILQPPGYVVILYEFAHVYRIIPLDGRPPIGDSIRLWMGDSRGHWEGNTLVVDVTHHNGRPWLSILGDFHSDAMHEVERFTFVDTNQIDYEITLEDPKVYTRPWKMAFPLERITNEGFELMEYACYEGNVFAKEFLKKQPGD